jgi:hypothetical protein
VTIQVSDAGKKATAVELNTDVTQRTNFNMAQFFQPAWQGNDNDISNSQRVAGAIRMSIAGTQPNIGLLHSGVTPASQSTPNQQTGPANFVTQGPGAVSVPGTPLNVSPVAAATSGPNFGAANLSLISAMSTGDDGPDATPYTQAPTLGPNIPSNAAGAVGASQTTAAIGQAQLDNVQFSAAPAGTITSLTLVAPWPRPTASNYIVVLSTGQVIYGVTLTNGATTCTFASTSIQGSPTALAAVAQ